MINFLIDQIKSVRILKPDKTSILPSKTVILLTGIDDFKRFAFFGYNYKNPCLK